ncbi:MAG: cation:proton antiporter [Bacteroidales bacterium]|nr:cation:proton antiporter [Bacteroidales bacterium]
MILIGILIRLYADANKLSFPWLETILPTVGAIGLILIVLDGALELSIVKEKRGLITRAFLSALCGLLLTITALTLLFHFGFHLDMHKSIVNAIPLSIISSAIAIPSSIGFPSKNREFIIYESTFSDILGIILFNHVVSTTSFSPIVFWSFSIEIVIILVITLICSFLLVRVLDKIEHKIKYFLLVAVLIILYAVGKMLQVSSLMLVFFFGLLIANSRNLFPKFIGRRIDHEKNDVHLRQLHLLTGESAFLIRTFFFLIFGYTIAIRKLENPWLLLWGSIIFILIFLVRFLYLRVTNRDKISPEVYIAPRGLINILLFLSIPSVYRSEIINQYVLLIVLLLSLLMMIWGGISMKKPRDRREMIDDVREFSSKI